MIFETAFNCGDKGWIFNGEYVKEATIGQIRIQYTKSPGLNGGYVEPNCNVEFDNYKPFEESLEEVYMCVETGINSGDLHILGRHIFKTKEECEAANAKQIAELARERAAQKEYRKQQLLSEETYLRDKLARIERMKESA